MGFHHTAVVGWRRARPLYRAATDSWTQSTGNSRSIDQFLAERYQPAALVRQEHEARSVRRRLQIAKTAQDLAHLLSVIDRYVVAVASGCEEKKRPFAAQWPGSVEPIHNRGCFPRGQIDADQAVLVAADLQQQPRSVLPVVGRVSSPRAEQWKIGKRLQSTTREHTFAAGARGVCVRNAHPATREPRRRLSPRVACKNTWARVEPLKRNQTFIDRYREARADHLAGREAIYPAGTWWLPRFAGLRCADLGATAPPN
jgi:hypothetical protein